MLGRIRLKILLALVRCLLVVALKVMILEWENLHLFGLLREKVPIQENVTLKLEIWIMMNYVIRRSRLLQYD